MRNINTIVVSGNLGRDPELKYGQNGTPICNFSLGVSDSVKRGDGWVDETDWINVRVLGKQAETITQYLAKGSCPVVTGRLKMSKYEKDGETKYFTYILADQIQFPPKANAKSGPRDIDEADAVGFAAKPAAKAAPRAKPSFDLPDDNDLPF